MVALSTDIVGPTDILDAFTRVYFAQYRYDLFRGVSFFISYVFPVISPESLSLAMVVFLVVTSQGSISWLIFKALVYN